MAVYTAFTFDQTVLQSPTLVATAGRAPMLFVASPGLPSGTVGVLYSCTLRVIGGTGPYRFTVTAGTLPDGLSLNTTTGIISGTPTVAGTTTATVTIQATDTFSVVGASSFAITVNAADADPNTGFIS